MFPVGLYLLALTGGAVISAASLPLWRRWCEHVGLVDAPGHRKIHDHPVPLAGGLAVVTGLATPILAAAAWVWFGQLPESFSHVVTHGLARRGWQLTAILGGALAMLALGILDDRRDLSAKWKFVGQMLIALAVAASGIRVTVFVESPSLCCGF
jgi:UDP-GlcNAc:undecaprenyl-phosphate GlcNAc-1-phosphate transferase